VTADPYCRGSFVGAGSNPGINWSGANRRALGHAERAFLRELRVPARAAGHHGEIELFHYGRRVIRAYGEAIDAATRVAVDGVRRTPRLAESQRSVAQAVTGQLTTLVLAMQRCALGAGAESDVASRCFGKIEHGVVAFPPVLDGVASLGTLDPASLKATRGCAAKSGEPSCLTCTTWRNAVRAVSTLLGEHDPPDSLDRPPLPARHGHAKHY
jgi:hypothetical protein